MQIMIDISKNDYTGIIGSKEGTTDYQTTLRLYDAVRKGTVLSKSHGKIIDESAITEVYTDETEPVKINGMTVIPPRIVITGTNAPTIIEPYKIESEDKDDRL